MAHFGTSHSPNPQLFFVEFNIVKNVPAQKQKQGAQEQVKNEGSQQANTYLEFSGYRNQNPKQHAAQYTWQTE